MKSLKVCFIGIGSIAKRHIRNLSNICSENGIDVKIDALRRPESGVTDVDQMLSRIFYSIVDVPSDYDIAFITNPTEYHLYTLRLFHNKAKHFFIEKPITTMEEIDQINGIHLKSDSVYYVAAPLRYNAVIQYIKKNIDINDVISVRSISSSYLPEWRAGTDYRNTYSAHKKMGGGVSIDLIHEWDYLTYIFGAPTNVLYLSGKVSDLEIDCEDYAAYMATYPNKIIELHLDYFGRKTIREIQLITKYDTIVGDIANNRIKFLKEDHEIDFAEQRNDYQKRELQYFLNMIEYNKKSDNDIKNAVSILKLTQGETKW